MAITVTPSNKNLKFNRNVRIHGDFSDGTTDVTAQSTFSDTVRYLDDIKWSIDSTGHIRMYWQNSGETIAFLSGNGRWDFDKASRIHNPSSDDVVVFDTTGFADLDSFTVILTARV